MQVAADTVVFLTGFPIAAGLIVDGLGMHRAAEVAAGLALAVILGAPSLFLAVRRWLRATHDGADGEETRLAE